MAIIRTTTGSYKEQVEPVSSKGQQAYPRLEPIQVNSSDSENTIPTDTSSWVSGPIGVGYYEGKSSMPQVLQPVA
ncbi:hypothetical protein SAY87_001072 [Trapa incisa]|uniref:Uncharacterized protein n=1 Tax=Trapa incisa TaxID=236973 RepID=A0AAN7GGA0_9MYRT|nr:hypothetical protein SAY87_001072 [Trapa incisa]